MFYVLAAMVVVVSSAHLAGHLEGAVRKEPMVIVVSSSTSEPYQQVVEGFWQLVRRQYQQAKGYSYFLGSDAEKNRQIMEEIASRKADMFFTLGSLATREIQTAYSHLPLVATMVIDDQLLKKSKQTTGVTLRFPAKVHLHWLRRLLPEARHVYLLYNPMENSTTFKELAREMEHSGLEVRGLAVESVSQLPAALKSVGRQADVLLGLADQTVYSGKTAKAVLLSTFQDRIAFAGLSSHWVKAGALYALERDYADLGRQCGEMACRILGGTPVAAIATATPDVVKYVINMKTARHLRLTINPALVEQAAEVFE